MIQTMTCRRCATPAWSGDRFCSGCGAARGSDGDTAQVAPITRAVEEAFADPSADTGPIAIPTPRGSSRSAVPDPDPVTVSAGPARGATATAVAGRVALGTLSTIGVLFRLVNGGLTVISGIAITVIASHDPQLSDDRALFVAGGVAWALYGGYILLTRRSYWVSGLFTYLVPIAVIAYETGAFGTSLR